MPFSPTFKPAKSTQAISLRLYQFPQSKGYADCLYGLGVLCKEKDRSMKPQGRYIDGSLGTALDAYLCDSTLCRSISL